MRVKSVATIIINEYTVVINTNGNAKVFTNTLDKQKLCNKVTSFFNCEVSGNVCLLFTQKEVFNEYCKVMSQLPHYRKKQHQKLNPSGIIKPTILRTISTKGCCTIFVGGSSCLYDSGGRGYADRNKYEIIPVRKIKLL